MQGAFRCTDCPVGKYNDRVEQVGVWNCWYCSLGQYQDTAGARQCKNCPAGKALNAYGSSASSACTVCDAGYVASNGAAQCSACERGKYATLSVTDDGGGIDSQVLSGAKICNPCPAGYFSNFDNPNTRFMCQACSAGQFSTGGAVECTDCVPGKFSRTAYAECSDCEAGTYNIKSGMGICIECADNSFSVAGSVTCDFCAALYYSFEGSCLDCPEGSACMVDGINSLTTLPLMPGYWRIQEATTVIRSCPMPAACAGGPVFDDNGDSYCKEGFTGPLCAVCKDGFFFEPSTISCTFCEGSQLSSVLTSIPVMSMLIILGIVVIGTTVYLIVKYNSPDEDDDDDDGEDDTDDDCEDGAEDLFTPLPTLEKVVEMPAATECRDHHGTVNGVKGIAMTRKCPCGNTFKPDSKFCRECGNRRKTLVEDRAFLAQQAYEESERKRKEKLKRKLRKARESPMKTKTAASNLEIGAAIFNATTPESAAALEPSTALSPPIAESTTRAGRASFGFGKIIISKGMDVVKKGAKEGTQVALGALEDVGTIAQQAKLEKAAKRRKSTFDQDLEAGMKYIMKQKKYIKKMQTKLKAFMAFSQM